MMIEFKASSPFIKQRKSDKGWIVELEVDQSQYEAIRDLPTPAYEGVILNVSINDGTAGNGI